MQQVVMIGGPTAVGKTALAIYLAQERNVRLINADAFQIYQGMDIGTAKPTAAEQAVAPHHLIDIKKPSESFTVAQFMTLAHEEIKRAGELGQLPVLVGGTGFYLNALRLNLPLGTEAASPARARWQAFYDAKGPEVTWAELQRRDPVSAAKIPAGNARRVIRALEVIENTGRPFSDQKPAIPIYETLVIGLTTDREILYQRINQRVDLMMKAGLLDEVRRVQALAGANQQALAAIGYKEFLPYLAGAGELDDAIELVKRNSRRYAKRQLTYFHNQMPAHWFDLVEHPAEMAQIDQLLADWVR